MITARHFTEKEFNRCTPACSLQDMHQRTMDMLDAARDIAGIPFILTCAYRSAEYDKARGRSGTGAHPKGYAVDIRCNSSADRFKIVCALMAAGFTRIGIGKIYVHADNDPNLAQNVIWHYY